MKRLGSLIAIVVAAGLTVPTTAPAQSSPDIRPAALTTALTELNIQLRQLAGQPGAAGRAGKQLLNRRSLVAKALSRKKACDGAAGLRALRGSARKADAAPLDVRSRILAASLNAESILRARPTRGCSTTAQRAPAAVGFARALRSTSTDLSLRFQLPAVQFTPTVGAGRAMVTPSVPDLYSTATGMPAIPSVTRLVAIPQGASLSVAMKNREGFQIDGVDISPTQPDPDAQAPGGLAQYPGADSPVFRKPPFSYDAARADSALPYPRRPFMVRPVGTFHGLRVAAISVPIGQYVGKSDRLKVFSSVDLDVRFTGGKSTFGSVQHVGSGLADLQALAPLVVNLKTALGALERPPLRKCGARLVIVTTPELAEAAGELAAVKRAAGMSTLVAQTGAGEGQAGISAPQIAAYLRGLRATDCGEIPQHVILYGKAVPTFIRDAQRKNAGESTHATDYPYGLLAATDIIPVLGVGRLAAKTPGEARVLNAKIQTWMQQGPADPDFYKHTFVAGYYEIGLFASQTNQTFIQSLERARKRMQTSGRIVDRLYEMDPRANPLYYADGTMLPSDLVAYDWARSKTADITAAFNAGRSLVLHNDHGYDFGWGDPGFGTEEVKSLSNGDELPLVWSINCYSGRYDDPNVVSFAEEMTLKSGGGALAVVASSRMSNTYTNGIFTQNLAAGLFPTAYPGVPTFQGVRGMGANLNAARLLTFVSLLGDGSNIGAATDLMHMYNLFGDPTLKIRVLQGEPGF